MPNNFEEQKQLEKERAAPRVHTFFEIDAKTERTLIDRIQKSKGLIRLFVHPDFKDYSTFTDIKDKPEAVKKLQEAEKIFQKILSSNYPDAPPIFIFEGAADQQEFQEKEEGLSQLTKQDVYVIRTENANPNPLSPDKERTYQWSFLGKRPSDEDTDAMWKWVIDEFKKWKVKNILIGGLELYISPEHNAHDGCLGKTMEKLKDFFTIEMSTMTWPSGRSDLKK